MVCGSASGCSSASQIRCFFSAKTIREISRIDRLPYEFSHQLYVPYYGTCTFVHLAIRLYKKYTKNDTA